MIKSCPASVSRTSSSICLISSSVSSSTLSMMSSSSSISGFGFFSSTLVSGRSSILIGTTIPDLDFFEVFSSSSLIYFTSSIFLST